MPEYWRIVTYYFSIKMWTSTCCINVLRVLVSLPWYPHATMWYHIQAVIHDWRWSCHQIFYGLSSLLQHGITLSSVRRCIVSRWSTPLQTTPQNVRCIRQRSLVTNMSKKKWVQIMICMIKMVCRFHICACMRFNRFICATTSEKVSTLQIIGKELAIIILNEVSNVRVEIIFVGSRAGTGTEFLRQPFWWRYKAGLLNILGSFMQNGVTLCT